MKRIFALLILLMMFVVSGCVRMDATMDIKPDGSVDVNTKLISDPMLQGELLGMLRKSNPGQKIKSAQGGRWTGYEGTASYKSITDMAKANEFARGLSIPDKNILANGVLYKSGILYDYCTLDLAFNILGNNNLDSAHAFEVPDSPGIYFTLRSPSGVETNNADKVSEDKKVLSWDLAKFDEGGKYRSVKASFKIWHKSVVIGLALLAVALLGVGAAFYKKSVVSSDAAEMKNQKNISFAALGAAALILVFMIAKIAFSPTLTSEDRISPIYDASGKPVAAEALPKDNAAASKENVNKTATSEKKESKPTAERKQSATANNSNGPIVIAGAYHSSADQEGNYVHSAKLAVDGNASTCWSEGVKGVGIGENIEIHFNGNYKVSGMDIWIGHQKSEALFYQNARPVVLRIVGSDGSEEVYNLNDTFGSQRVIFKNPITVNKIKLVVERVAMGSKYEDTCIAEVKFF